MSELEALQTTLAAEHAAVFVYGALGGRTSRDGDARCCTTRSRRRTPRTGRAATC